jgi:hypothetical protein
MEGWGELNIILISMKLRCRHYSGCLFFEILNVRITTLSGVINAENRQPILPWIRNDKMR